MSDLCLPSWICAVPLCRTTHTVEEALAALHQSHSSQLVLTTDQDHAFAALHLKDLLWGLASRTLRLDQNLAAVSLHHPLCLWLLATSSPQEAWWNVWQRLEHPDRQGSDLEYGFINPSGDFLGILDYPEFLSRLVEYCPDQPLKRLPKAPEVDQDETLHPPHRSSSATSSATEQFYGQMSEKILSLGFALLQENHQLQIDNREKRVLLDRLSHDLKTPLTSILGLAQLLKENLFVSPSEAIQPEAILHRINRQRYYGQIIYKDSRYLMSLVNLLMELVRLETQQKVLNRHNIPLQALLHHCWSQAQEEMSLRIPTQAVRNPQPCPELDPSLEIWGDRESSELLFSLFLTYSLEQELEGRTIALTAFPWGAAFPQPAPWLILHLEIVGAEEAENAPFMPNGEALKFPDPLDLWLARRFAQWQGGDLSHFGANLALVLPQAAHCLDSREDATHLDPTFVLVGLHTPQDWFAGDSLTSLVTHLQAIGIFTLFATDCDDLTSKLQRFRPSVLLLDYTWEAAWEALSLYCVIDPPPLDQFAILGITLSRVSDQSLGSGDLPIRGCFQLPEDDQRLRDYFRGQPSPHTFEFGESPTTFLWLGQSGAEENCSSLFPGCQILEADDVEQAELLVQIWDIEAIVLQSSTEQEKTLNSIRESSLLSPLRLIALNFDLKIGDDINRNVQD